jgi:hypothetical protein
MAGVWQEILLIIAYHHDSRKELHAFTRQARSDPPVVP